MAKKTESVEIKKGKVVATPEDIKKLNKRIDKLGQRITSIVDAIDKCKRIKGM